MNAGESAPFTFCGQILVLGLVCGFGAGKLVGRVGGFWLDTLGQRYAFESGVGLVVDSL